MTKTYGKSLALKEYLLKGNKISFIEAGILFGIGNLWEHMRLLKKDGFVVKSQKVPMALIMRRLNKRVKCETPKNLPTREINMIEYWINE